MNHNRKEHLSYPRRQVSKEEILFQRPWRRDEGLRLYIFTEWMTRKSGDGLSSQSVWELGRRGGGSKPLLQHIKTKILYFEDELLVKLVNAVDTGFWHHLVTDVPCLNSEHQMPASPPPSPPSLEVRAGRGRKGGCDAGLSRPLLSPKTWSGGGGFNTWNS